MDSLHALSPKFPIRTLVFMVIFWVGLLCIAEVNASGGVGELLAKGVGSKQREFDYFKLALQWPGTYCRKTNRCCSTNACCRGSNGPTGFTIHGLWADYNDGSWPSCCTSETFDVKEISSLGGAIYKYWPSLSCGSPSNCHGGKGLFWEHEWEKHGTCCVAVTGDEYNYFVTALNLYFKYNVTEVLAEAGYVASNSEKYPLGGIISAIQNAFHLTPSFKCTGDAVEELYLCFTKEFTPRDCADESITQSGMVNSKKSCPAYVSLPEYDSTKIGGAEREVSKFTLQSSI